MNKVCRTDWYSTESCVGIQLTVAFKSRSNKQYFKFANVHVMDLLHVNMLSNILFLRDNSA